MNKMGKFNFSITLAASTLPANPPSGANQGQHAMSDLHTRRVAVVAGMGPGLGAAVAASFHGAGYRVAGLSRRKLSAGQDEPAAYRHYACDLTRPAEVDAALKVVRSDLGEPDALVYNPMQLLIRPFLELSVEEMESAWRTTCLGAMVAARAVLPAMVAKRRGTLIFSGATASQRGSARFAALAVGKFGLRGLAQSLAREFGPEGIHVVHTVLDGLIWAPQTRARFDPPEADCMAPQAIASTYLQLVQQHPSAWTHEIDLRPAHGKF